jgi:hypothetical protein
VRKKKKGTFKSNGYCPDDVVVNHRQNGLVAQFELKTFEKTRGERKFLGEKKEGME